MVDDVYIGDGFINVFGKNMFTEPETMPIDFDGTRIECQRMHRVKGTGFSRIPNPEKQIVAPIIAVDEIGGSAVAEVKFTAEEVLEKMKAREGHKPEDIYILEFTLAETICHDGSLRVISEGCLNDMIRDKGKN